jgi:hypothetical protein
MEQLFAVNREWTPGKVASAVVGFDLPVTASNGKDQSMKRLFIATALTAAMLVPASQALASSHHPKGEYAQFAECPLSHPALEFCLFSESNGGFFQIGKKTVPLKNPVVLQGGIELNEKEEGTFVGAENGETLVKTPQTVPGGLLGIEAPKSWPLFLQILFNETINNGSTGVTATVELAAPASSIKVDPTNLISETGDALVLPVKIKLSNPFLGNNCYIGSNAKPVVINFTTGETSPPPPNKKIHGAAGSVTFNEAGTIITVTGGSLVNNSFAAPGANGCGGLFSFLVDPFVNSLVGIPSAAGTNSAILEGKFQLAIPAAVKASE